MTAPTIRLLLVEDNPADALLLRHALADAAESSFEVSHVQTMADAGRRLADERFDAILLDLSLPDSRGLKTVEQANAVAPQVPIIVMTGLDDEGTAIDAVRSGAQDFLIKGTGDGRLLARCVRYAMERKHAEAQLKSLNETLEQRVADRTAVATRRATQLQALASELTLAEHRERRRLAQFLHDHMQQLLYAARLNLDALKHGLREEPLLELVERIDELLNQSLAESRSLIVQLTPTVLDQAGLAAAVQWLGRHMEQNFNLPVDVRGDLDREPESEDLRILLFQSVRELLFNVVKHARANRAAVTMSNPSAERDRAGGLRRGPGLRPVGAETRDAGRHRLRPAEHPRAGPVARGTNLDRRRAGRGTRVTIVAPCRRQGPTKPSTLDRRRTPPVNTRLPFLQDPNHERGKKQR